MSLTSNEATAAPELGRRPEAARATTPATHLYRVAWRWHLYAGLFVIPFLVVLALSGSVYLFKPQLDRAMYPQTVAPAETALLPSQQLAAAQAAHPGATVTKFKPAPSPDRSAEVMLTSEGGRVANQLLMLGACAAVVLLSFTGMVMWWTRRPKGRIGAPATPRDMPLWRGATAIMFVLGAVFPLMGISLILVLALDHLLIDRIPALRRILA